MGSIQHPGDSQIICFPKDNILDCIGNTYSTMYWNMSELTSIKYELLLVVNKNFQATTL